METFQSAVADFLRHCRFEKDLGQKTLKAYNIDLTQFGNFLRNKAYVADIAMITKAHLREYLESLVSLKPRSIKRKMTVLKTLFNYLEFEDKITVNPFRKMRIKIRQNRSIPTVMDMREIAKIFTVAYKPKSNIKDLKSYAYLECIRNISIIELLFATGARVSEISNLKKDDINLYSGSVKIKGKGNKERVIQVCNSETISILKNYQQLCFERKTDANGYFLINRFFNKLSDQSIRNIVKKLCLKAGITKRVTPHVFRHSFATFLLEREVDIKYIQSLLGHSSIMTTQIYTHVNRAKQTKILKAKHPRKELCMIGE